MLIHPAAILSIIITLVLNWKLAARRKFILITVAIYALAIIATAFSKALRQYITVFCELHIP